MAKPFLWRYGRVDFNTERNIDRSSTKSPVTWQAVASWYIMCSVLKDYKWFKRMENFIYILTLLSHKTVVLIL